MIINCDLGEWESREQTEALMRLIGAANIACGGHAGDRDSIRFCTDLAREHGVLIGAHPGLPAVGGRGEALPSPAQFRELLLTQLQTFYEVTDDLHHVKLHGSLYHAVERHEFLTEVYVDVLTNHFPCAVFALAGGSFAKRATDIGLRVFSEGFADRGYLPDGSLIPRSEDGALIHDLDVIRDRALSWQANQAIQTVCVHSDSPQALDILKVLNSLC